MSPPSTRGSGLYSDIGSSKSGPMISCCAASAASEMRGRLLADLPFGGDTDLPGGVWLCPDLVIFLACEDKAGKL